MTLYEKFQAAKSDYPDLEIQLDEDKNSIIYTANRFTMPDRHFRLLSPSFAVRYNEKMDVDRITYRQSLISEWIDWTPFFRHMRDDPYAFADLINFPGIAVKADGNPFLFDVFLETAAVYEAEHNLHAALGVYYSTMQREPKFCVRIGGQSICKDPVIYGATLYDGSVFFGAEWAKKEAAKQNIQSKADAQKDQNKQSEITIQLTLTEADLAKLGFEEGVHPSKENVWGAVMNAINVYSLECEGDYEYDR